jgi:hypothetical protein
MAVVRSRTCSTTFRRIADAGDLGPLLIKLMMAVNDLGMANYSLGQWKEMPPTGHENRSQGARSYFVRLMMAHTFEALKVIHKINATPKLKKLVDECDGPTRAAFARLVKVTGTADHKAMKRIRNAVVSHYETDAIEKATERQSDRFSDHPLTLSIGRDLLDWYFEPADIVVDSIIVRDAIGLKDYPVVSAKVDEVATRLQKVAEDFANFSGYFIPRHVLRR